MSQVIREDNRIIIPSSLEYLREVEEYVEEKLKQKKLSQDLLADIAISVTEVVTNAVCHGNRNDSRKKVYVSVEVHPRQVVVSVADEGTGFDPAQLPNPTEEENLLKDAGRGIFIVKSLMDEVKFEAGPKGGTTITLVKNF